MRFGLLLAAIATLFVQPAAAATIFNVSGTVTPDANGRGVLSFAYPTGNWPFRAEIEVSATPNIQVAYTEQKGPFYTCNPICVPEGMTGAGIELFPTYSGNALSFTSWDFQDFWTGNQLWTFQASKKVFVVFEDVQAAFNYSGFLTLLPEPGTWTMMLIGIGAIGAALRRRQLNVQSPPLPALTPLVRREA